MASTLQSSVPTCVRVTRRACHHPASQIIPSGTALPIPLAIHRRRDPPRLTSSFWTNPANGFVRRAGALKRACASAGSRIDAASSGRKRRAARRAPRAEAVDPVVQFSPDDFSVERLLGTLDFMNVSSYSMPPGSSSSTSSLSSLTWPGSREDTAAGLSERDINQLAGGGQEVGRGGVQIRMYRGRMVTPGERLGTRVLLKAYPGREAAAKAVDVDAMAANELVTHVALQEAQDEAQDDEVDVSRNVLVLLGGFETSSGEKWLVMRDDGYITAADYAKAASEATAEARAVGDFEVWDRFDPAKPLFRREIFIRKLLRGFLQGLSYMHSKGRLHQSIGPASIVLNTTNEMDVRYLVPRLRDFAFAIDISNPSVLSAGVGTAFDAVDEVKDSLWRRAAAAGAKSFLERRSFGLADDIYAAGLLVAYMAFVPLCAPGAIDGPSLQRLLETTFSLNIPAAREYCSADDRWTNAVAFLDRRDGAGWEVLQAMLSPDYRQRPSADSALQHRFFDLP
ncbi:unnamed protein product [Closterium sp. Yama58-4]|nr:unnamed protein product [Closterium sp. Yama58-4]